MITKEQFVNGVLSYADAEVMPCLPTTGKWGLGTMIFLSSNKLTEMIDIFAQHPMIKALGLIDESGNIDSNRLLDGLMQSANRYGKLEVALPIVGTLRFSSTDVERLRSYIGG